MPPTGCTNPVHLGIESFPPCHPVIMWIGWMELDLLLGDVHSLKEKRSFVRPLISELRRKFELSVAEVDYLDLHRRVMV